jgi:hypothetical protein
MMVTNKDFGIAISIPLSSLEGTKNHRNAQLILNPDKIAR